MSLTKTLDKPSPPGIGKPTVSHLWLSGNPFALCGAGPRTYKGDHPDKDKFPRCDECAWKVTHMGYKEENGKWTKVS